MQYFVDKTNGERVPSDEHTNRQLMREFGYRQVICTPSMQVVRNIKLRRKEQDTRLKYGGGRLRQPYDYITGGSAK